MSSLALARDTDVGVLLLQAVSARKLSRRGVRVDQRVTGGELERTMEGASTLRIELDDHDRALLRSGMFSKQFDLRLDGLWWRLVQVSKQGDELTLTFEDRGVAYLRQITTPRKAARSKMTRAEFALSIVREVKQGGGIPFFCPELHIKQKVAIATDKQKLSDTARAATRGKGLASSAPLTMRYADGSTGPMNASQRGLAERALDVAASLGASTKAQVALIEACMIESGLANLSYGDSTSAGILQLLASTAASSGVDQRDVEAGCNAFLLGYGPPSSRMAGAIKLDRLNPGWSAGRIAQEVQRSGYPARYDRAQPEASAVVAAFGGGGLGGTVSTSQLRTLPYQFQRGGTAGEEEDSWACLQRLAQEVQWRCFMADGTCYFASETSLMQAKPRATLSEETLGVSTIDFQVDNGKADSEATVTARALRLGFPPGSVVVLDRCGPADGRWLVRAVSRGLFDAEATISLKRPTDPLPEPAAETESVSTSGGLELGGDLDLSALGGDSPVLRAYAAAQAIDQHVYPYVWGGGHAHAGTPDGGTGRDPGIGYDCSGSTGAVLAAAGMGYTIGQPVPGSGDMAVNWGQYGEGQTMTVWAKGGEGGHVWIEFKLRGAQHFGTGEWGISNPGKGPRFQGSMHYKESFTPRHWPGT